MPSCGITAWKRVLVEGLTENDMPALPAIGCQTPRRLEASAGDESVAWPKPGNCSKDFPEGSYRHTKAAAAGVSCQQAGTNTGADIKLKMGAAVQLLVTGRLEAVLPLDDAQLLARKPSSPCCQGGGRDPAAVVRANRQWWSRTRLSLPGRCRSSSAAARAIWPMRFALQTVRLSIIGCPREDSPSLVLVNTQPTRRQRRNAVTRRPDSRWPKGYASFNVPDDVADAAGPLVAKSIAQAQGPIRELTAWVKSRVAAEPIVVTGQELTQPPRSACSFMSRATELTPTGARGRDLL